MLRVDAYPTHKIAGYDVRIGTPLPFGATPTGTGVNFSVFSRHATRCELVLFQKREPMPLATLPFPNSFRIGNVFTMCVFGLDIDEIEYAYRLDGPFDSQVGHRFDPTRYVLDPYATLVAGRNVWGEAQAIPGPCPLRARIARDDFDWGAETAPKRPMDELIIYEMHVRGFTRHPSSGAKFPGTFAALYSKIPYLQALGINCVELLPIFEYDELENAHLNEDGTQLFNYWGYSTVGFFAPKAGLAASSPYGMQMDELKRLIKALHAADIEVMLDVVFNHTAEGNEMGPTLSFRGIDNKTYYMLTPDGYYFNFSGCGNTLNCNHPIVRGMILDCLRYWVAEYHIDGFRFDLASILGRNQDGTPMVSPPLLESLAFDPVLANCKLVAEAWDAGGLYEVGTFASWGRWVEWNGKFRDDMRRFLKGDQGMISAVANRLQGSPDLYDRAVRGTCASINFITCHDGFTLNDLVSFSGKHNLPNGEGNRDGSDDNFSWNCGWEGETDDPAIVSLRKRQMKNALTLLLFSRGVPMLLSGDEFAHTQGGNNNAYCQDNSTAWLNWNDLETHRDLWDFTRRLIAFRKEHYALRSRTEDDFATMTPLGYPQMSLHSQRAWFVDYTDPEQRALAVMYGDEGELIYLAMNMHWQPTCFELPSLPLGHAWYAVFSTDQDAFSDVPVRLSEQGILPVAERTSIALISQKSEEEPHVQH